MSERPRDDEGLEAFLARRSTVSQAYRDAAREEPAAELDDAILAASRQAVGTRPRRGGWIRRWSAPLAAAAVIVLAVAVTLNLRDQADLVPRHAPPASSQPSPPVSSQPAPGMEPESGLPGVQGLRAPQSRLEKKAAAQRETQAPVSEGSTAVERDRAGGVDENRTDISSPAAPMPDLEGSARPATSPPSPAATDATRAGERRVEPQNASGVSAEKAQAPPALSAGQPAREEQARSDLREPSAAPARSATTAPQTVLRQIESLYSRGADEEGDRALREFCKRFPQHPLSGPLQQRAAKLGPPCAAPR
jgi:hypothetical protein